MPPTPPAQPDAVDLRCECGAMLARRVPGGIEIRCRRCHRSVIVTDGALVGGGAEVEVCRGDRKEQDAAPRLDDSSRRE